ncbi:MAG: hypothetical protein QCI38_03075 [Candidatus Thermoplasmatota archaeon]|nr:hypothetical protein [Candidatus Thermoplasmatota archaeon]
MEVVVQPLLIDKYEIQATSKYLNMAKANDPHTTIFGLTKKEATLNAQYYKESHAKELKKEKHRGAVPRMWWQDWKFHDLNAKSVSLQSYGAFCVWINGNPTMFQKEAYTKQGLIDTEKNRLERRHHDNYLYTDICKLPPEQIERENIEYLPRGWEIAEYISREVLGHQPMGYENPNVYTHLTFRGLEVNQDLLTYPYDSIMVANTLWQYLTGPDGQRYLYDTRCEKMTGTMNTRYAGARIILTYDTGQLKIYPKTNHGLRVEVMLKPEHIQQACKNRSTTNLQKLIDEVVRPLLKKTNIPTVLGDLPPAQNITPQLLEIILDDPQILHMAKKTLEYRALTRDEIPPIYRNKGKKHIYKAERRGREWLYYLRPEFLGGTNWYD